MAPKGAVVIGGYINGLGVIRALAARGVPVAVVPTQPYDIAGHSRFVTGVESGQGLDDRPELLPELLRRRASDWKGWALVPTTDGALAALARHREELAAHHPIIAPSPEAIRRLLDKPLMRQAAEAVGIRLPRCYGPATRGPGLDDIVYPVVVKPDVGFKFATRFGCKLLPARDRTELDACIARVEAAGIPCEIHELIPGPDDRIHVHCTYLDQTGEPWGGVTIRKLRQSPTGFGVARVAEIAPTSPELHEATVELAHRLGIHGLAVAEFKLDARDGRFRFMEINGRSIISNRLVRRAGMDLAGLAWADQVEGRRETVRPVDFKGIWVNLHADLMHGLAHWRTERFGWRAFAASYRRPLLEAVWSAHDPAPFFAQWARTARAAEASLRPAP